MKKLLTLAVLPLLLLGCNKGADGNAKVRYESLTFSAQSSVIKKNGKKMKFQLFAENGVTFGEKNDDFYFKTTAVDTAVVFSHNVTKFDSVDIEFKERVQGTSIEKISLYLVSSKDYTDYDIYNHDKCYDKLSDPDPGYVVTLDCPYKSKETGNSFLVLKFETMEWDESVTVIESITLNEVTVAGTSFRNI